jgi:hypothetical protein
MRNALTANIFGSLGNSASIHPSAQDSGLIFSAFSGDSGLTNLSSSLTINSTTLTPVARFEGGEADAASWTATIGENLAIGSSGTDPTVGRYTPFTDAGEAVKINSGKIYVAANTAFLDPVSDTEDWIFESVFKYVATGAEQSVFGKFSSAGNKGLLQTINGSSLLRHYGVATAAGGSTLVSGCWYHVMAFADRNGNTRCYLNGAFEGSSASGTTGHGNSETFAIGAWNSGGTSKFAGDIALVQIWKATGGTINTTAEQDSIAKERAVRLSGFWPQRSAGTAAPFSISRASNAYLDRIVDEGTGERRLFRVGVGWLRLARREEATGGERATGALIEPAATNLCLQSEAFGTTWTSNNLSSIVDGYAAPNGDLTADAIVADGYSTTQHGISQAITLTAAAYTFSVFAKAGATNWICLRNSTASVSATFNVSTGATGTVSGSAQAAIEDYGAGWYRCSMRFTGTAAAHTLEILAATDTSNSAWSGNGSISTYFFGSQVEAATLATTYIPTTTASAARSIDYLVYNGFPNVRAENGTVSFKWMLPVSHSSLAATIRLFGLGDGGTNNIYGRSDAADTVGYVYVRAGAVQADIHSTGSTFMDGELHQLKAIFRTDQARFFVNGTQIGSTDTSLTTFANATAVYVAPGSNGASTPGGQFAALISEFKVYSREA